MLVRLDEIWQLCMEMMAAGAKYSGTWQSGQIHSDSSKLETKNMLNTLENDLVT